jgi:HEAT repeat protein
MLLLHPDHQMRLEAAVVLSEIRSRSAFGLLLSALEDTRQPLFLRSACAWALGCHGSEQAAEALVRCFADVSREIREEALASLVALGGASVAPLVRGLALPPDVAAGSAEALRRLRDVPVQEIAGLADLPGSVWPTWVLAHLPKESVIPSIAALQTRRPEVHFAITVLWTFLESWIAENWTPRATP